MGGGSGVVWLFWKVFKMGVNLVCGGGFVNGLEVFVGKLRYLEVFVGSLKAFEGVGEYLEGLYVN